MNCAQGCLPTGLPPYVIIRGNPQEYFDSFEGQTVQTLNAAFKAAVDSYLEACEQQGIAPKKPLKRQCNVRIGHERHVAAAVTAKGNSIHGVEQ